MQHYRLVSTQDSTTLFEGTFYSFKACLEQAVKQSIRLDHIDLSHKNLSNANLDGGIFAYADFTESNLTGANLSESYLKGARFIGSSLYNTFFCDSNLSECNFESASFGATDIHGAIITAARFSSLSCFTLDFTKVRQMENCLFLSHDGTACQMSRPPVVIRGIDRDPIIFMDRDITAGHNRLDEAKLDQINQKLHRRLTLPGSGFMS